MIWLLLWACQTQVTDKDYGGGTGVGNPSRVAVVLAPDAEGPWESARADLWVRAVGCDGSTAVRGAADVDLTAGTDLELVANAAWCGLAVEVSNLVATGPRAVSVTSGSVLFEVPLEADAAYVVELGAPADPGDLDRSALYVDVEADGALSTLERARGPVSDSDREDAAVLVVGDAGTRIVLADDGGSVEASDGLGDLVAVAHDDGRWLAVGDRALRYGDDGWQTDATPVVLSAVTAQGGQWYAVSETGAILRSGDGVDWEQVATIPGPLYGIDGGRGLLVAVGDQITAWSEDGQTWTTASVAAKLYDVWASPDRSIAVGFEGARWVLVNEVWTEVATGGATLRAVERLPDGSFFTVGDWDAWTSVDGDAWTPTIDKLLVDLTVHRGVPMAIGDGAVYRWEDDWVWWANAPGGRALTSSLSR